MPRIKKRQNDDSPQKNETEVVPKMSKKQNRDDNYDFTTQKSYTDLVLKVDGKNLYVNRSVLMMASPVFQKMFESDFCEKSKDSIDLPEKKFDDFHCLLKMLVPGCRGNEITHHIAQRVYPLAEEYQMDNIKTSCLEAILKATKNKEIRTSDILNLLNFAHQYGIESLEEACTNRLVGLDSAEMKEMADVESDISVPWSTCQSLLKVLAECKEKCSENEQVQDMVKGFFDEHSEHCKAGHMSSTTCCRKKCDPVSIWRSTRWGISPHCWQHIVHSLMQSRKFVEWMENF